jgi:hypothetical protein
VRITYRTSRYFMFCAQVLHYQQPTTCYIILYLDMLGKLRVISEHYSLMLKKSGKSGEHHSTRDISYICFTETLQARMPLSTFDSVLSVTIRFPKNL